MPPADLLRRILSWLLFLALGLPIAICVLLAFAQTLSAMGDAQGGLALARLGLACGVVWALVLVGLPIVLALRSLAAPDEPIEPDETLDE